MHSPAANLFTSWQLNVGWWCYLLAALVCVPIIRAFLCLFKIPAIGEGEHLPDEADVRSDTRANLPKWDRFKLAFGGFRGQPNIPDYWLPALIGYAELCAYPVLLTLNETTVIGGWLAIKTAGGWRAWERSRTTFNRFLATNLLVIAIAYFWLARYVRVVTAP
jgi:hypothetical protein